ncbi:MAG TPA: LLM class flavin-dependent oxidoreductase [Chloroflexota bacterium]|nr:LLM class flavin-dependent oxidoreductase [Chloroflexota bacterium]
MNIGLFSNGKRRDKSAAEGYDDDIEEIVAADRLGCSEAWISEHIGINRPATMPVPELMIAKLSALTTQIKMGVAVRCLPLYHPIDVATMAATCDHLTKGRYLFGFGGGGPETGLDYRGIEKKERHARMEESLDLILKCWTTEGRFNYEGRFYRGERILVYPKPYQKPYPPMAVASSAGVFIDMAAREGYTLLCSHYENGTTLRPKIEKFLNAARAAGREPDRRYITVCRQVYVADSAEEAKDDLREGANYELDEDIRFFGDRHLKNFLPPSGRLEDVSFDQLADEGWFILGDPERVYQGIRQLYDESGGFGTLLITVGRDWSTNEKRIRSLERLMTEVYPRLADLPATAPTAAAA